MTKFTRIDPEEYQGTVLSLSPVLLKLEDLQHLIQQLLRSQGLNLINKDLANQQKGQLNQSASYALFGDQGVDCEILKPGDSGWKKGKLRVKVYLEFEPDEPEVDETIPTSENPQDAEIEFPLDEVRKAIADLS